MIEINLVEMTDYIHTCTGIDKETIIKVLDAEEKFLELKGVIG